ncbi:hypothetical protein LX36DRAFT_659945 [Colletotrichum falcatum]|nr:hypothetical protein LX36DRAFT_659945 [Colletotrichum falcatum]
MLVGIAGLLGFFFSAFFSACMSDPRETDRQQLEEEGGTRSEEKAIPDACDAPAFAGILD